MAGILIIAHAPFAQTLLHCAAHIYEHQPERVDAFDVFPQASSQEVIIQINSRLQTLVQHNSALILTDVCGATPANIASHIARTHGFPLLAGMNLPMLLRAIAYRTRPLETLVQAALTGGTHGVMRII
jgi:mannose PTS system EIIA component